MSLKSFVVEPTHRPSQKWWKPGEPLAVTLMYPNEGKLIRNLPATSIFQQRGQLAVS